MENNKIKAIIAILSFLGSLVFGAVGCFCPPLGAIEPTMLIYTAELLLFCSFCLGISNEDNKILKEVLELLKEFKK